MEHFEENSSEVKSDYRSSFRTVGLALIVLGLLDVGVRLYHSITRQSFFISFTIFAVLAGVLLLRGSLITARITAFFSAILLSSFTVAFVIIPFLIPLDFTWTYFRLHPASTIGSFLLMVGLVGFLLWVYRKLTTPNIFAAMEAEQVKYRSFIKRPATGFVIGTVLVVVLCLSVGSMLRGEPAKQAKMLARNQVGTGYKFFVTSMQMYATLNGKKSFRATVTAYNSHEIKQTNVVWEK